MASDGDSGLPAEPAERVRAILERVVDALDVEAEVEVDEDAEQIVGRVDGEDVGLLIGRRGQTIDAVQLLCYRAAFQGGRSESGWSSTPPATASAARRRSSARPTAPPSGRCRRARRSSSSR